MTFKGRFSYLPGPVLPTGTESYLSYWFNAGLGPLRLIPATGTAASQSGDSAPALQPAFAK